MSGSRTVTIDVFPESVANYDRAHVVVAVDVIRATTTAVTALASGRRCFVARTAEDAFRIGASLVDPLYAGEMRGIMPEGFHIQNSPTLLQQRPDVDRPLVLLSTAGTELIVRARDHAAVFAACLRNHSAQVAALADHKGPVVVIGAGGRGEFRIEDKIGCALVAGGLMDAGFSASRTTSELVDRWCGADLNEIATGTSAAYLRNSDQEHDLRFVLNHVDDIDRAYRSTGAELVEAG